MFVRDSGRSPIKCPEKKSQTGYTDRNGRKKPWW